MGGIALALIHQRIRLPLAHTAGEPARLHASTLPSLDLHQIHHHFQVPTKKDVDSFRRHAAWTMPLALGLADLHLDPQIVS